MVTLHSDRVEDAWQRLRRHVAWSDVGALGFVLTNSTQTAELLRQRSEWQLKSRARKLETIVPETSESLSALLPAIEGAARRSHSVWVQQTATDSPGARDTPWADAWRALLRSLNHRRDSLRSALGTGTLYLVGSRDLQAAARDYAPDVWSVRAFVIDAEAPPASPPVLTPPQLDDRDGGRDPFGLLAGVSVAEEGELGRELAAMLRGAETAIAQGRRDEAFEQASGVVRKTERRETAGLALLLRGAARRNSGDTGGGLSDGLEALKRLPRRGPERLRWLDYVADGAASLGDLRTAQRLWHESLAIARELDQALGTPASRRDLSVSLERVGEVLRAQDDTAAALAAYQESLAIRRELDQALGTPESRRDLSVSLEKVGEVLRAQGDAAVALAAYQESLAIRRELDEALGTPESRRDLSVSLNKVGDVLGAQGDAAAALAAYQESLAIRRELDQALGTPESRRDLSISLNRVGDVRGAQGDVAAALDAYQESLAIARELDQALGTPESRRDLSISLDRVGDVLGAQGDAAAALAAYQESLAIARELDQALGTPQSRRDLSISEARLADVQRGRAA